MFERNSCNTIYVILSGPDHTLHGLAASSTTTLHVPAACSMPVGSSFAANDGDLSKHLVIRKSVSIKFRTASKPFEKLEVLFNDTELLVVQP